MPKQTIEPGTVLYKKVYGVNKDNRFVAQGIVSFVVTEPGFMATWELYTSSYPEAPDNCTFLNTKNKCRVRAGTVLSVEWFKEEDRGYGPADVESWISMYDHSFKYTAGAELRPRYEFDDADVACGSGIHGFLTREQAEAY